MWFNLKIVPETWKEFFDKKNISNKSSTFPIELQGNNRKFWNKFFYFKFNLTKWFSKWFYLCSSVFLELARDQFFVRYLYLPFLTRPDEKTLLLYFYIFQIIQFSFKSHLLFVHITNKAYTGATYNCILADIFLGSTININKLFLN